MIQVAPKLGTLTPDDTVALAVTIITALPNAAGVTPDPMVSGLQTLHDAAQDGLDAMATATHALAPVSAMPDAQAESTVVAAGMRMRSASTHETSLGAVTNLSVMTGGTPRELDWHRDPVARARVYGVEWTSDPVSSAAKWTPGCSTTASGGSVTGLESGSAVSLWVHAEGARGLTGVLAVTGLKAVP